MLSGWEQRVKNISALIRGKLVTVYLRAHGCEVGKGLKCRSFPDFRYAPKKNISIGNHVTLGRRITLIVKHGHIELSDHVNLTQDNVIASVTKVSLGKFTLVAEYVSIRDASHDIQTGEYIAKQGVVSSPITIGEDVWIGAGSRILKGAKIPQGCVIGANSIVLEKSQLKPNVIYAGTPVKQIGARNALKQTAEQH